MDYAIYNKTSFLIPHKNSVIIYSNDKGKHILRSLHAIESRVRPSTTHTVTSSSLLFLVKIHYINFLPMRNELYKDHVILFTYVINYLCRNLFKNSQFQLTLFGLFVHATMSQFSLFFCVREIADLFVFLSEDRTPM